ncbi:nuclear transport factor 2 family protein [Aliiglaciecola sp. CAU 1673]|uniref:nuclear transport factor 2 family protein n=1 Tax=Aliiglaciecola sp. CAU 1673 TaxID=3032595 RepID=UPI0023DBA716|nr:nuclear transport factor 2 family protein [Aliiglaciecola sp. CAU 1673]MDF2179366.1 nuclear transport factor 2 family protein [Aliiglaciecola sp. CAU 1673]
MAIVPTLGFVSKIAAINLLLTGVCQANDIQPRSSENANLEKALYCMEILENRPDLAPAKRIDILREQCFSEHYIQHSPHVEDGREAVLAIFAKRYQNHPDISTSIKRTAADGDLVWIHQHVRRGPEDLGRAVVNIFRMQEGKFAEHWNVIQAVPADSKNDNSMF